MPDLLLTLPFALMTASLPAAPMCSIGHAAFFATPAESAGSVNSMAYPLVLRSGAGETPLAFALPGSLAVALPAAEPEVADFVAPAPTRAGNSTLVDLSLAAGGAIAVPRAPDGLFYVHGTVNGVVVRFLVDTGATSVVLTAADAARAGLAPTAHDFQYSASTAGGRTAMARVRVTRLVTGATDRRDVDAAVVSSGLTVSLLGQSWLAQLRSLSISGNTLTLE